MTSRSASERLSYGRPTAVWLLALAVTAAVGCSDPEPINVLLISLDTTRADHLGAYGHPEVETPNIDRLAAEGVLFEQCSSPTPLTLPSHATLMTGTYPFIHGVRDNGNFALAEESLTLAEALGQGGYTTGGQVAVFILNRSSGLAQGFDAYRDTAATEPHDDADGAVRAPQREPNELRADAVVDSAIDWLRQNSGERFFLFVHLFDPHSPYAPPEPFRSRFDRPGRDPRIGRYLGEISYVDQQIGRLTAELTRLDLDENTLIILTADHGEAFGEHTEIGHSYFVYDVTTRVPLIVRLPGRATPGRRVEQQVRLVDVAPTILDLAGLPPLPDSQGVSLSPLLEASSHTDLKLTAYLETMAPYIDYRYSPLRGLRNDRWKYILAPRPELYDLQADPGETENVHGAHPQTAARMRRHLVDLVSANPTAAAHTRSGNRRQLESLGYLAVSGAGAGQKDELNRLQPHGPDPKDRIESMTRASTAAHALLNREFARAASIFNDLARAEPENVLFLAKLAESLVGLRRHAEAQLFFSRVLEIDSQNVSAHQGLVQLNLESGELAAAASHLQQLTRLLPDNPAVFLDFGRVLAMGSQLGAAELAFETVLELDPTEVRAASFLARISIVQGRPSRAGELLEAALEQRPDSSQILLELAWLRATSADESARDGARALQLAEHARRQMDAGSPALTLVTAAALATSGQYDAAQEVAATLSRRPAADPRAAQLAQRAAALAALAQEHQPYLSSEPF